MQVKTLKDEYVVATPTGKSQVWSSDSFWKMAFDKDNPANNPQMGYLMSQFSFEKNWDSWEMHPNGDEVVFCVAGSITFILEIDEKHQATDLAPGQYVVVPQGVWHTARVKKTASALFLTWGFGTQHRRIEEEQK